MPSSRLRSRREALTALAVGPALAAGMAARHFDDHLQLLPLQLLPLTPPLVTSILPAASAAAPQPISAPNVALAEPSEARTRMTVASSEPDATTHHVQRAQGFSPRDRIVINPGSATEEEQTLVSTEPFRPKIPLRFQHGLGEGVVKLRPAPPVADTPAEVSLAAAAASGTVAAASDAIGHMVGATRSAVHSLLREQVREQNPDYAPDTPEPSVERRPRLAHFEASLPASPAGSQQPLSPEEPLVDLQPSMLVAGIAGLASAIVSAACARASLHLYGYWGGSAEAAALFLVLLISGFAMAVAVVQLYCEYNLLCPMCRKGRAGCLTRSRRASRRPRSVAEDVEGALMWIQNEGEQATWKQHRSTQHHLRPVARKV